MKLVDHLIGDSLIGDISPAVIAVEIRVEREISPIMEKAVVIGIVILPRPILSRQLTITLVLLRDIVALIVVKHSF